MLQKAVGVCLLIVAGVLIALAIRYSRDDPRRALAIAAPAAIAAALNIGVIANRPWRPATLPRVSALLVCAVGVGTLLLAGQHFHRWILPDIPRSDTTLRAKVQATAESLPYVAAALACGGVTVATLPARTKPQPLN